MCIRDIRYAQQGDHTDPVNFDWDGFLATVNTFHNQAIAYRTNRIKDDARNWQRQPEAKANTYLKPHKELGRAAASEARSTREEDDMSAPTAGPATAPEASPATVSYTHLGESFILSPLRELNHQV